MTIQDHRNTSSSNITFLNKDEIFVYGANSAWRHGSGAAKQALKWGAVYGQGPFRGQTYGICTKDWNINTLPLDNIYDYITLFIFSIGYASSKLPLVILITLMFLFLAYLAIK